MRRGPSSRKIWASSKDFAFVAKLGIELGVMKQPIDASKLTIG
jgi:hypothetical protein